LPSVGDARREDKEEEWRRVPKVKLEYK